jgi:hypothetical protein
MRPPWSYPLAYFLLGQAQDTDELFDILAHGQSLTPRARADRPSVVALLARTEREHHETGAEWLRARGGYPNPGDEAPWFSEAIARALRAAGYLNERGWDSLNVTASPGRGHDVDAYLAEVRASTGRLERTCRSCHRMIPHASVYCGYCGRFLAAPPR